MERKKIEELTGKILNGDCLEVLKTFPDNSIETLITDPPYGLSSPPNIAEVMQHWIDGTPYDHKTNGFMGKSWDSFVPNPDIWRECLRVLKPGGTALVFAGSRTQDLMSISLRFAGFQIKDTIMWIMGSGFPKATDISKQLDKKRTGLKFNEIRKHLREQWKKSSKTQKYLKEAMGDLTPGGGRISHYFGTEQASVPNWNDWVILKKELNLSNKYDDLIIEYEREVIGKKISGGADAWNNGMKNKEENKNLYTGQKEHDITEPATEEAKLWNGWKSHGLKPAYEPIIVAMKPNEGSYAQNALKHGVSGLWIDGARVGTNEEIGRDNRNIKNSPLAPKDGWNENSMKGLDTRGQQSGRFPANIILECTCDEVIEGENKETKTRKRTTEHAGGHGKTMGTGWDGEIEEKVYPKSGNIHTNPNCPCYMLDEQSGESKSVARKKPSNTVSVPTVNIGGGYKSASNEHNDKGGASRFFYCAKSSKSERNRGLDSIISIMIEYSICQEKNTTQEVKKVQLLVDTDKSVQKVTGVYGAESKNASEWNTVLFGNCTMEKFLQVNGFTTKTTTNLITTSAILNWLMHLLTNDYTLDVSYEMGSGGNLVENVEKSKTLVTTINEKMVSALGVKNVVLGGQLKISVNEGSNFHSTVKPLKLMEYLCKLTSTPTKGCVLDPFAGSGTTLMAAKKTGRDYIGIEREEDYVKIAEARIKAVQEDKQQKLL